VARRGTRASGDVEVEGEEVEVGEVLGLSGIHPGRSLTNDSYKIQKNQHKSSQN
jgi:hypothetical protein